MLRSLALVLSTAALTLGLAACASDSSNTNSASSGGNRTLEDTNFRVGSRIPIKDPVSASPTGTVSPSATGAPQRIN